MVVSRGEVGGTNGTGRNGLLSDTHAHLDDAAFAADLGEVVSRAHEAGVDRILAVGSDLRSSIRAVQLAHRYDQVFAAVGVHPHQALSFPSERQDVRHLLADANVVAVGEIGLDYSREIVPREAQLLAFREQLAWADELGMPASIHNRSADRDMLITLSESGATPILHCFSSSWDFALQALELGGYVSFAGNLTFPKAHDLRHAARLVPGDRILIETDAPVLAPQPWRGKRNEPAWIAATARTLASVRGVEPEEIARTTTDNANLLFGWGQA